MNLVRNRSSNCALTPTALQSRVIRLPTCAVVGYCLPVHHRLLLPRQLRNMCWAAVWTCLCCSLTGLIVFCNLLQLDALGRPADLSQRLKAPSASRAEAARELAALKQAHRECEDATAAYNELVERLQERPAFGSQVSASLLLTSV